MWNFAWTSSASDPHEAYLLGPRPPQSFLTSVFSVSLARRSSVWSSYSSPSPCRRILFQEPLVNSSALWYCQRGHQSLTTVPVELTLSTEVESDTSTVHSWYAQGCPVNAQMEDKTKLFVLYFSIYCLPMIMVHLQSKRSRRLMAITNIK